MGISRLKRLITEDFARAFTTQELAGFTRNLMPNINFYSLTGYPLNTPIPRKEAAKQVTDYICSINKLPQLLNLYISACNDGFRGEKLNFNNRKYIYLEMNECGLTYNSQLNKVVFKDQFKKRNDWGFLEEEKEYIFSFISIDIVKNSYLVRSNDNDLVRQTYKNFKNLVDQAVEKRKGRIWNWEGDGGLLVFHLNDFINLSVLTAVDIITSMPVFNNTQNLLNDEIQIRIAINVGPARYSHDQATINSPAIVKVREIEKHFTDIMSITISHVTYQHIDSKFRHYFIEKRINEHIFYQFNYPNGGKD